MPNRLAEACDAQRDRGAGQIPPCFFGRQVQSCPVKTSEETPVQGIRRKLLYVAVFEALAIAFCTVGFAMQSGKSLVHAGALSVATSAIAVAWNLVFTHLFEAWEARQATGGRGIRRRVAHAALFEAGLLLIIVPLTAAWLEMSLPAALLLNIGLAGFFLVYTFVFNWSFDRLFGLPASARK
jgi:uncharacterized membrane protein